MFTSTTWRSDIFSALILRAGSDTGFCSRKEIASTVLLAPLTGVSWCRSTWQKPRSVFSPLLPPNTLSQAREMCQLFCLLQWMNPLTEISQQAWSLQRQLPLKLVHLPHLLQNGGKKKLYCEERKISRERETTNNPQEGEELVPAVLNAWKGNSWWDPQVHLKLNLAVFLICSYWVFTLISVHAAPHPNAAIQVSHSCFPLWVLSAQCSSCSISALWKQTQGTLGMFITE